MSAVTFEQCNWQCEARSCTVSESKTHLSDTTPPSTWETVTISDKPTLLCPRCLSAYLLCYTTS